MSRHYKVKKVMLVVSTKFKSKGGQTWFYAYISKINVEVVHKSYLCGFGAVMCVTCASDIYIVLSVSHPHTYIERDKGAGNGISIDLCNLENLVNDIFLNYEQK